MRTRIERDNQTGGTRITVVETGESVILADVGRCYRIYHPISGYTQDVAKGRGWDSTLRQVRAWVRTGTLPILDTHLPALS